MHLEAKILSEEACSLLSRLSSEPLHVETNVQCKLFDALEGDLCDRKRLEINLVFKNQFNLLDLQIINSKS